MTSFSPAATLARALFVQQSTPQRFGDSLVSVSKRDGKKAIGAKAYVLGEVSGVDVDTEKWQITHLHVSLTDEATKEFGFRKPLLGSVIACLPINIIQATGDVISLNKPITELKNLVEPKKHS